MKPEECEMLKHMHGIVRIQYDQEEMAGDCTLFEQAPVAAVEAQESFPFFLQSMSAGSFSTLAPVMRGEEYFTTPHVCMGYYHGVQIRLLDCTYCERTCEPYTAYMQHFESKKNGADAVLEEAQDILKRREAGELNEDGSTTGGQQSDEEWAQTISKASFDREQAKLFLVSLLGRNNMGLDRPQTIVTKSVNDVISLLGDGVRYQNVSYETFMIQGVSGTELPSQKPSTMRAFRSLTSFPTSQPTC